VRHTREPTPASSSAASERRAPPGQCVRTRGGQPRRRALDLAIAATANVHNVPLLTHNLSDFQIIDDLIDLRTA
jgi:predicted nucleic acid-binding protein